jgi:hypothetical protein
MIRSLRRLYIGWHLLGGDADDGNARFTACCGMTARQFSDTQGSRIFVFAV